MRKVAGVGGGTQEREGKEKRQEGVGEKGRAGKEEDRKGREKIGKERKEKKKREREREEHFTTKPLKMNSLPQQRDVTGRKATKGSTDK